MESHILPVLVIVILVAFGLYRRIRRTISFQPIQRRRMSIRCLLFVALLVLFVVTAAQTHLSDWVMGIGILLGLALAWVAAATTRFEIRNGVWHYRPSGWVSGVVLLLFIGRLAYRLLELYHSEDLVAASNGQPAHLQANNYTSDPWTVLVIVILFAYYAAYFAYLLWKERQLEASEHGHARN
ncbi:CcdC protein domain-containing protein [Alicyclobacillus shizuokensis]|uniref:CcdC protein domain-containing protein n=1 Tax=Alicyclobacillus shizuokensis TaxID=392014 RepID=UPI0008337717|nr:CcdC protein domain-containing protein [Alicyclobacillus shizuokensis]